MKHILKNVVVFIIILTIVGLAFVFYRNSYLQANTRDNLGKIVKHFHNGKLVDYQDEIGVTSAADVTVRYDSLLRVYTLMYGNIPVYISGVGSDPWSYTALEKYLNGIGMTMKGEGDSAIFYYYGEEIVKRN